MSYIGLILYIGYDIIRTKSGEMASCPCTSMVKRQTISNFVWNSIIVLYWLLCFVCLPGVSGLLCGSSLRCRGFAAVYDCGISDHTQYFSNQCLAVYWCDQAVLGYVGLLLVK